MALQKTIETNNGINTTAYFRIEKINLDYVNKNFNIFVEVYFNKTIRESGKKPLFIQNYNMFSELEAIPLGIQIEKFDQFFSCSIMDTQGNVVHQAYEFLKSLNEFKDATDV